MKLNTLEDLMIDQLHGLYNAEMQITGVLPRWINEVSSADLRKVLQMHAKTSVSQISRLDNIFYKLGITQNGNHSEGMQGLIKECESYLHDEGDMGIKDAALVTTIKKIEQYELEGYGTAMMFARELGYNDIADLLQVTINEERENDKQLTSISHGGFFSVDEQ